MEPKEGGSGSPDTGIRKVLVTGLGRSGTSSISSMLHYYGFNLCGEAEPNATFEDVKLRKLMIQEDFDRIEKVLRTRVEKHRLVAWKDPKIYDKHGIKLVRRLPDDWVVIVVFRDPVAIVTRRAETDKVNFSEDMVHVGKFMQKLHSFAAEVEQSKQVIYVSYEKLMSKPIESIRGIFAQLGTSVSADQAAKLWNSMQESHRTYQDVAGSNPRAVSGG